MGILQGGRRIASLALIIVSVALAGCGAGENVTPGSLEAARRLWELSGIRDYDLEWKSTGPNSAHYFVTVRGGEVRSIESMGRDGSRHEVRPAAPQFYSVDGLFTVISDELVQLREARPFGQPKGTNVVMRFDPDTKQGYPRSYHRDVLGTPQSLAIEVLSLRPVGTPPGRAPTAARP